MVDIIEKGELPGEKLYETTCSNCKTRFRFKKDEAKVNYDQREGDYLSIACPLTGCNKTVTVDIDSYNRQYGVKGM